MRIPVKPSKFRSDRASAPSYSISTPVPISVENLNCGGGRNWLSETPWLQLSVVAEKLNYLGRITFHYGGGQLRMYPPNRGLGIQALAKNWDNIPSSHRALTVSAYTGLPITESKLAPRKNYSLYLLTKQPLKHKTIEITPLSDQLTDCVVQSNARDPYMIGKIKYVATYQGGSFSRIEKQQDDQAFLPELTKCFEKAIRDFTGSDHQDFEITLNF